MLYPICPTCGAITANIQLPYQRDMRNLCDEYGVDHEMMSRALLHDAKFNAAKEKILNKYTDRDRYCCRMRLTNFTDVVELVH